MGRGKRYLQVLPLKIHGREGVQRTARDIKGILDQVFVRYISEGRLVRAMRYAALALGIANSVLQIILIIRKHSGRS